MGAPVEKIKMHSACFHAVGPPPSCSDTSVLLRFPADRDIAQLQDEVQALTASKTRLMTIVKDQKQLLDAMVCLPSRGGPPQCAEL